MEIEIKQHVPPQHSVPRKPQTDRTRSSKWKRAWTRVCNPLRSSYISSGWAHAFISLSLKATVNIWIIKPFAWPFLLLSFTVFVTFLLTKGEQRRSGGSHGGRRSLDRGKRSLDVKVLTNKRFFLVRGGITDEWMQRKSRRNGVCMFCLRSSLRLLGFQCLFQMAASFFLVYFFRIQLNRV